MHCSLTAVHFGSTPKWKFKTNEFLSQFHRRRDRLVVRTLRCGRSNPGSNPGHDTNVLLYFSTPTPTPTSTPFWFSWRFISMFLFDKGKKITVKDFLFKFYREFSFFLLLLLAFSACVFVCFYFSFLFFFQLIRTSKRKMLLDREQQNFAN